MNLFSAFKSAAPAFDVQKAIMTIVVAAIKVDGDISDDEI